MSFFLLMLTQLRDVYEFLLTFEWRQTPVGSDIEPILCLKVLLDSGR